MRDNDSERNGAMSSDAALGGRLLNVAVWRNRKSRLKEILTEGRCIFISCYEPVCAEGLQQYSDSFMNS